tara:strand:- start:200 stop:379 length:180 start_codon:yes stop_codon:yes gene_type:complete
MAHYCESLSLTSAGGFMAVIFACYGCAAFGCWLLQLWRCGQLHLHCGRYLAEFAISPQE